MDALSGDLWESWLEAVNGAEWANGPISSRSLSGTMQYTGYLKKITWQRQGHCSFACESGIDS